MRAVLFIFALTVTVSSARAAAAQDAASLQARRRLWLQPNASIAARVAALLPELTLEDKLWQLQRGGTPATGSGLLEAGDLVAGARSPADVATAYNSAVAAFLAAGPGARTGLPPAWRTLATHGGDAFGTVFPQGPGLASAFDVSAAAAVAAASAAEARALGISLATFVINLWADARFGRQEEGFSEEPALTAGLAAACVSGAAAGAPPPGAETYLLPPAAPALFKHVGAYGAAAGGVNGGRADAPAATVLDVYLKPWRRAAAAGAIGVMPSHRTARPSDGPSSSSSMGSHQQYGSSTRVPAGGYLPPHAGATHASDEIPRPLPTASCCLLRPAQL